jgi:hypothetical protein
MSETPRTDALAAKWSASEGARNSTCSPESTEIYAHGRKLERELAAALVRGAELEKAIAASCDEQRNEYSPCQRAIDAETNLATALKAQRIAELKAGASLANNLCPDHRDKQNGRRCLACLLEEARKP